MTKAHYRKLEEAFTKALALNKAELAAYLEKLSEKAPLIWEDLISLLALTESADALFDKPILSPGSDPLRPLMDLVTGWALPKKIGPYEIQAELGQGGMGNVYLAVQREPIYREVAIKVLRNRKGKKISQRLRHEQQALALMNHDHIARIYDIGVTDDETPYFTMEHVDGRALSEFIRDNPLPTRERVQLFLQVCDGVIHAHTRGVIHGDLKPSNILVISKESPTVKIIDFGIARAHGSLTSELLKDKNHSQYGSKFYMSPEQAKMEQPAPSDIRTDVYASGAILFELVTGTPVFEPTLFENKNREEILRTIRQDERMTPSARVRAIGNGTEQRGVLRELKYGLDPIIKKTLAVDPEDRYTTMNELRKDLLRYLENRPVEAARKTPALVFSSWLRRNRYLSLAALALTVTIILGVMGSLIGYFRTQEAFEKLTVVHNFYGQMLRLPHPYRLGSQISFVDVLKAWEQTLPKYAASDPDLEAKIRLTLGETYLALGLIKLAEPNILAGLQLNKQIHGERHRETLKALTLQARKLHLEGSLEEAESLFHKILARQEKFLGPEHSDRLYAMYGLAIVLLEKEELEEAYKWSHTSRKLLLANEGPRHYQTHEASQVLANVYYAMGKYDKALSLLEETHASQVEAFGENHFATLLSLQNMATNLFRQGRFAKAAALHDKVAKARAELLGPDHAYTLSAKHGYALALWGLGRYAASRKIVQEVLEKQRTLLGENHQTTLSSMNTLAMIQGESGQRAEAIVLLLELMDLYAVNHELQRQDALKSMSNLGHYLKEEKRYEEGLAVLRNALELVEKHHDKSHPAAIATLITYAETLMASGNPEEAESQFRRAAALMAHNHPAETLRLAEYRAYHAQCLTLLGRYPEAEKILLACYQQFGNHSGCFLVSRLLSDLYQRWGQPEKAAIYRTDP